MIFDMDGYELTKNISYAYLIVGLVELLLLACFFGNDVLLSIGISNHDLIATAIFDILVFAVMYRILKDIDDRAIFALLLIVIAVLDLILFFNIISLIFALFLIIAAYKVFVEN